MIRRFPNVQRAKVSRYIRYVQCHCHPIDDGQRTNSIMAGASSSAALVGCTGLVVIIPNLLSIGPATQIIYPRDPKSSRPSHPSPHIPPSMQSPAATSQHLQPTFTLSSSPTAQNGLQSSSLSPGPRTSCFPPSAPPER